VLDMRLDHGAERRLLQVQQLRHDQRLRVSATIDATFALQEAD
jgi:hypothetical protein